MPKKVVVLASGSGSNFQTLLDFQNSGAANYEIIGLIVNIPAVFAIERAKAAGIAWKLIDHKLFPDRTAFEAALHNALLEFSPDVIVCAGFMRILQPEFVEKWEGKMINIHPSLLPKYKGLHTHRRAIEAGDQEAGCSVHFVNAGVDEGALIGQATVPILPNDDEKTLAQRVLTMEHKLFPICLNLLANGGVLLEGNIAKFAGGMIKLNYGDDKAN